MLDLFVGKADQCFQRVLIAEPVVAAHLQDLGRDEALDQAEHVGVRASLHLAQQALLAGA